MFFLKSKEPVSPEEVEREKQRKSEEFERRKQDLLRRLASLGEQFENGAITVEEMEGYLQVMEEILMYGKTKKQMRMEGMSCVAHRSALSTIASHKPVLDCLVKKSSRWCSLHIQSSRWWSAASSSSCGALSLAFSRILITTWLAPSREYNQYGSRSNLQLALRSHWRPHLHIAKSFTSDQLDVYCRHWQESIKEWIEVAIAYYPVKLVEQAGL
jgi:hypothetical protein